MIAITSDILAQSSDSSLENTHAPPLDYSESENNPPTGPRPFPHKTDYQGRPPPPRGGYSWKQILSAIESNSLHLLRRTDKGQYEYEQWMAKIDLNQHTNIGKYIALEILHWPDLVDPADQIQNKLPTSAESDLERADRFKKVLPRLTLRLNHYPFPVQASIQYFVLWSTRDMSLAQERHVLDQFLEAKLSSSAADSSSKDGGSSLSKVQETVGDEWTLAPDLLPPGPGKKKEWIWFVNPIALRSVATVHHLHVFVRDVDI